MIINTNINSLNSQRQLAGTSLSLKTATERLSSGLRINIAADDAAGMAISDRMTAQIRGLNQARRNANDGISLVQTAEGAIIQMTNNLQRIRELAVQAANDTNTSKDRQTIQKEVQQLKSELTRIANTTQFNGRDLLNGKFAAQQFQVGANAAQTISIDMSDSRGQSIGNNRLIVDAVAASDATILATKAANAMPAMANWSKLTPKAETANDHYYFITGKNVDAVAVKVDKGSSMETLANAINDVSGRTGVTASARTDFVLSDFTKERNYKIGLRSLAIEIGDAASFKDPALNPDYAVEFTVGKDGNLTDAVNKINAKSLTTGVKAQLDSNDPNRLILSNETGRDILFDAHSSTDLSGVAKDDSSVKAVQIRSFARIDGFVDIDPINTKTLDRPGNRAGTAIELKFSASQTHAARAYGSIEIQSETNFSIGIKKLDNSMYKDLANDTLTLLGKVVGDSGITKISQLNTVDEIDVSTRNGANDAIKAVDAALAMLDAQRADLGAIQNRLTGTISNLRVGAENLSAARSRIQDADYAEESAALSRATILQQAGTAMLAQANQQPQLALQLLS